MSRRGARVPWLALIVLGVGCAAGRPLGVSTDEWAAYRATRVLPTLDERLSASQRYLRDNPDGAYAADVRRRFDHAEPIYFAAKSRSSAGLEAYLRALPTGPHARQAAERLAILRAREDAPDLLGRAYAQTEERLRAAADSRERARLGVGRWLAHFLSPAVFDAPLAAAPRDLVVAWGLSLPEPVCGMRDQASGPPVRTCSKIVQLPYSIPVPADERDDGARELTLEIMVREDELGRPAWVTLAGPDLFLRVDEAASVKPRSSRKTAHRVAAVVRAVDLTVGAFETHVSTEASCRKPVVAPEIVRLSCEGLSVVATAGENPGDDDRIVVSPLGRPPSRAATEVATEPPMDRPASADPEGI